MRIVSSEILEATTQQDGRIGVTEKHTLDDGNTMLHSYIADADFVLQEVAEARAAKINAVFDLRERQLLEANNFEAPISQRDFMDLIPFTDLVSLRIASASDPVLFEAIKYLELPGPVFKSVTTSRLNTLVANGSMTQALVDTIMDNWTASYG